MEVKKCCWVCEHYGEGYIEQYYPCGGLSDMGCIKDAQKETEYGYALDPAVRVEDEFALTDCPHFKLNPELVP